LNITVIFFVKEQKQKPEQIRSYQSKEQMQNNEYQKPEQIRPNHSKALMQVNE
jgi:hypothetical protein